jgi:hypothetical protein
MRESSETTTLRISDGTPEVSSTVIGLPPTGTRNWRPRILAMLSRVTSPCKAALPPPPGNMKERRRSACMCWKRSLMR